MKIEAHTIKAMKDVAREAGRLDGYSGGKQIVALGWWTEDYKKFGNDVRTTTLCWKRELVHKAYYAIRDLLYKIDEKVRIKVDDANIAGFEKGVREAYREHKKSLKAKRLRGRSKKG